MMRRHTTIGADIIGDIPGLGHVIEAVRASHERREGRATRKGWPGEQIPLGWRIIAVRDAFHAMTEARVYRHAMSTELAPRRLRRCSGTQFWPPAVGALDAIIKHRKRTVRYASETTA
jgi:HD-GYP domain-containing protein (c-di-GMP phosphodiesterase class II)